MKAAWLTGQVLDLSFIHPHPAIDALSSLLLPAASRMPSLRVLGLRRAPIPPENEHAPPPGHESHPAAEDAEFASYRSAVRLLVRHPERARMLDVIW